MLAWITIVTAFLALVQPSGYIGPVGDHPIGNHVIITSGTLPVCAIQYGDEYGVQSVHVTLRHCVEMP